MKKYYFTDPNPTEDYKKCPNCTLYNKAQNNYCQICEFKLEVETENNDNEE